METQEVMVVNHQGQRQLSAVDVRSQVNLIQQVMQAVMQEGFHYGVIPNTDKPTLLKPGAEKLGVTFRLRPELTWTDKDLGNGHREYQVTCTLFHIHTGENYGQGVGSCATLESKYRYRNAARTCPHCGKDSIIKGRAEYGGGWLCFQKKGGCGAKFGDEDPEISGQATGRVENPDVADAWNTCLKMAKKRAYVDAILTATAASDCFTQDLEDFQPEPARVGSFIPPVEEENQSTRTRQPAPAHQGGDKAFEGWQRLVRSILKGAKLKEEDYLFYLLKVVGVEQETDLNAEQRDLVMKAIKSGAMSKWLQENANE